MREFIRVAKALGDPNRARIVMFLRDGELCVCQVIELLRLAPSTVSKHLTVLHQAGLVESRKEGRWIYYRLADKGAPAAVQKGVAWVRTSLANNPRVVEDMRRLKAVRKMDIRQLCERYRS